MTVNYATYLHLDGLLTLQEPRTDPPEHDELLFITIHQISELWFQQLLHELDKVKGDLSAGETFAAAATFTRVRRILRSLVDQMDVLETMTPTSFLAFRDRLDQASGFQSMQFRELEFVLGLKRPGMLDHYPDDLPGIDGARRRLQQPSLIDHLYDYLETRGATIPHEVRARPADAPNEANEAVQEAMLWCYLDDDEVRILFELMTDIDEILQEWRYRHVKVVERTIGNKPGTGGSLGVEFLKKSLFVQVFPDLWAIRHRL